MKQFKSTLTILLVVTFILTALSTSAQLSHTALGIKGGMNISRLSVSGINDESSRIGYHVGAFARLGIGNFAIQPELLFTTKGTVINYKSALGSGDALVDLKYIDVPVLGVFYLTPLINFHAGPYASYLLNASVENKSSDQSDIASQIDRDNFTNIDYGIVAGIGIELRSLNLGVRYLQGLKNITSSGGENEPLYNFPEGKNSAWQLYVGLSIL